MNVLPSLPRDGLDGQGQLPDGHAQKVQEIERAHMTQRAELALTAAEMGTWEMAEDGSAVWDAQTYRLYGYDPGTVKLPADIYREALSDSEFHRTSRWLGKSLKYNLSMSTEFELRWPDGQVRWLVAQGRSMTNSVLGTKYLLGVNWDVTELRRARDALRRQQQDMNLLTHQLFEQEKQTTKKLAQVLHDQLGQTLTAARLTVETERQIKPTLALERIDGLLNQAIDQVRDLLVDLRPPLLDEQGLAASLDNEALRVCAMDLLVDVLFVCEPACFNRRWPTDVEYAFFMIGREAIANALAHAKARLIEVQLTAHGAGLILEIVDDGRGFSPEKLQTRPGHLGLVGMQERAQAIGARLSLLSTMGDGARVKLIWNPPP